MNSFDIRLLETRDIVSIAAAFAKIIQLPNP